MPEAGLDLEHTAASVAVARRFVTRRLLDWGAQRLLDPSVLLTSEVVTNAVFHGRPPVRLSMRAEGGALRVEVTDSEPASPDLLALDPLAEMGRGLRVVDALSSAWGCEPVPGDGKLVWFEVVG